MPFNLAAHLTVRFISQTQVQNADNQGLIHTMTTKNRLHWDMLRDDIKMMKKNKHLSIGE